MRNNGRYGITLDTQAIDCIGAYASLIAQCALCKLGIRLVYSKLAHTTPAARRQGGAMLEGRGQGGFCVLECLPVYPVLFLARENFLWGSMRGMGALARATRVEIVELVAGDVEWWPLFCGRIAEGGQAALKAERDMRGWSWGALWGWIVADEGRYRQYMQALEAYVQDKALETVGIADGSGEAKLMVDTRFRLAGKVDRARWGEQVKVDAGGLVLIDAGLVGFAGALLDRLSAPKERVIEAEAQIGDEI